AIVVHDRRQPGLDLDQVLALEHRRRRTLDDRHRRQPHPRHRDRRQRRELERVDLADLRRLESAARAARFFSRRAAAFFQRLLLVRSGTRGAFVLVLLVVGVLAGLHAFVFFVFAFPFAFFFASLALAPAELVAQERGQGGLAVRAALAVAAALRLAVEEPVPEERGQPGGGLGLRAHLGGRIGEPGVGFRRPLVLATAQRQVKLTRRRAEAQSRPSVRTTKLARTSSASGSESAKASSRSAPWLPTGAGTNDSTRSTGRRPLPLPSRRRPARPAGSATPRAWRGALDPPPRRRAPSRPEPRRARRR